MGNTLPRHQEERTLLLPPPPPAAPPPPAEEESQELTCQICCEPMPTPGEKFRNIDKCSHPFCTDCVIEHIRFKLEGNGNAGTIKCPAFECDHVIDPVEFAALVGPALFLRWCDALCEAAVLDLDRCYCPYRDCNVLIVNECGGNVGRSSCPECKRLFCFECGGVWHAGFGCEESGGLRDGDDIEFGRLAEQEEWMKCPRCRHFVERVSGCRHIRCRCGTDFCYKCGEEQCSCGTVVTDATCNRYLLGAFLVLITFVTCVTTYILYFVFYLDEPDQV